MLSQKVIALCPICESPSSDSQFITSGSIEIHMESFFFSVDLCKECGALYIKERTDCPHLYTAAFDPEKEHGYRQEGLEPLTEEIWNYHNKLIQVQELMELVPPQAHTLAYVEVGSGDGSLFRLFNEHCLGKRIQVDATLIESSGASGPCTAMENCRVISTSILNLPPEIDHGRAGGDFDVAVLSHCLEHFDNPRQVLAIVRRMLKSGGLLYIEVPDGIRSDYSIAFPLGYYHVVNYNAVNLSWMISQLGFDIVDVVQREKQPGLRVIARKKNRQEHHPIDPVSYLWTRGTVAQWQCRKNTLVKQLQALAGGMAQGEKILLYGAGVHTISILKALPQWLDNGIAAVTDTNPGIRQLMGVPVISPEAVDFCNYKYVVVSSYTYQEEIADRLLKMQCPQEKIIRLYDRIFSYDASKIR